MRPQHPQQYPPQNYGRPSGPRGPHIQRHTAPHGHTHQNQQQQQQHGPPGGPQQQQQNSAQQQQQPIVRQHQGQQQMTAASYPAGPYQAPMMLFQHGLAQMQHPALALATQQYPRYQVPAAYITPHSMIPQGYYATSTLPIQQVQAQQQQLSYYQAQPVSQAHQAQTSYYTPQMSTYTRPVMQAVPVPAAVVPQTAQQHAGAHHPQTHQQPQQAPAVSVPNIAQVPHHQQQPEQREPPQPAPTLPRKKKILQIVDPNTGKSVIDDEVRENAPSVSPQPTVEHVGSGPNDTYASDEGSSASSNTHPTPHTVNINSKSVTGDESSTTTNVKAHADDGKDQDTKKAKSDFFLQITRLADESGGKDNGRASSTPEAIPQASVQSTSPVPTPAPFQSAAAPVPVPIVASSAPVVMIPYPAEVPTPSSDIKNVAPPTPVQPVIIPAGTEGSRLPPATSQSQVSGPVVGSDSSTLSEPVNDNIAAAIAEESTLSLPATPNNLSNISTTSRGGGDDTTDKEASLVSISPTPMEKYDVDTPEKASSSITVESGEPSSIGSSTRESTASPSLNLAKEDESSTKPTDINLVQIPTSESNLETSQETEIMDRVTKSLLNVNLNSDSAQLEGTVQNGENEMDVDEFSDDDQIEEGELDEDSETSEPTKKARITYDKNTLMGIKASSDSLNMNSIPPELIKDGKPTGGNQMFNRQSSPGGFNSSRSGAPPRGRDKMGGGMHPMRGQMNPMGMQWNMGMGMIVPPPPPRAPKVITLNHEPVKLHKAEDAWKPSAAKRGEKSEDKDEEELITEDVVKKTRSILNKLTPENFDKLIDKFLQLKLDDKDERIGAVIKVVFEKAVDEPNFCAAYAKMVQEVCSRSAETSKKFRKKILDQCQKEFQTGNTDEELFKELEAKIEASTDAKEKLAIKTELDEKKFISRRRSLGNVRFIGELYKFKMLTPKIMVECINMLLHTVDEENYECLCKLLSTIGQRLDDQLKESENKAQLAQKQGAPLKWIPEGKFMENTFLKLKNLSTNNALSSRIRFALLDVYELRDNGWKPRRDTNAPKTIEEVRRAAIREEAEEKKQLLNLPPAQQQPPRLMQQQTKKSSEWNVVQSNKSSRFSNIGKKSSQQSDTSSELPKFAPLGGTSWGRTGGMSSGMGGMSGGHKPQLPPRFSRLQTDDRTPGPTPTREEIVQEPPPPLRTATSSHSSRESSRPQTPTREQYSAPSRHEPPPSSQSKENSGTVTVTASAKETVKNIFQEFMQVRNSDDTIDWVQSRFPGSKSEEFVEELALLVCDVAKEEEQRTAAELLKLVIKKGLNTKAQVVKVLQDVVLPCLPDIEVDVPKVNEYFAVFLVELYMDEEDLSWLFPLGEPLEKEFPASWSQLVTHTLNRLKLRSSEAAVKELYKKTQRANPEKISSLPVENLHWIAETVDSLSQKIQEVLQELEKKQQLEDVGNALTEKSWDLREEETVKGLIDAICNICWKDDGSWDTEKLQKLLPNIRFPSSKILPVCWQQAKVFIKLNKVEKNEEEVLWELMLKNNLIAKEIQRPK